MCGCWGLRREGESDWGGVVKNICNVLLLPLRGWGGWRGVSSSGDILVSRPLRSLDLWPCDTLACPCGWPMSLLLKALPFSSLEAWLLHCHFSGAVESAS